MFRPLPSYFVSSLAFSQSYRRVGSSDLGPARTFLLRPLVRGVGRAVVAARGGAVGATAGAGDGDGADDEPPKLKIITTMASSMSPPAIMTLVRFSVPNFIESFYAPVFK